MPDRVVSSSKLTAIANAIRTKAGTQSSMTLDEMPTAIANIPSGGGTIDLTGYDGKSWNAAVAPRLDTSGMTDMANMFYYQRTATSIDVSHFDTSHVTNMDYMFYNCLQLTSINLVSFNTSNVTTMQAMFGQCQRLTTINNISNLTTSSVTSMNSMFNSLASQAANPVSLDLSTFRTSNVTNMQNMFNGANLLSLDLDNWNTSNVTTMNQMFRNAFKNGGKMWVPSTFVATSVSSDSNKPFIYAPSGQVHVYTDATDATTQGWGTIDSNFIMHYNSTHQDFLGYTVTVVIPDSIEHSGGELIQQVSGAITPITLSPKATYRINQPSGSSGITVTASGNDYIISGTPTANVTITCTATQTADILTSTQKNFANWTQIKSINYGLQLLSGVSSSYIPWRVRPVTGLTGNEGYYYDLSSLPFDTPFQFSLTYKVETVSSFSNSGCSIGISRTNLNGAVYTLGEIFIPTTQSDYITQTVNITRSSSASNCYLVIINSHYASDYTEYQGKIYIQEMTLRQI